MEVGDKIYLHKYALTKGIKICVVQKVWQKTVKIDDSIDWYSEKDFCLTLEDAIKHAEKKRLAKIKSLEKQISRLKNLKIWKFGVSE